MGDRICRQNQSSWVFFSSRRCPPEGPKTRRETPVAYQSSRCKHSRIFVLSYTILPYTKIIIPKREDQLEKIIYSPLLETYLYFQNRETIFSFRCVVDSGADFCVFPAKFGELIGIEIKKGHEVLSFGVGGKETLYFHQVKVGIIVCDEVWKFQCFAGFSYKMNPKGMGLLGRNGFFDLFEEVSFNQNRGMFRLKGEGTRSFENWAGD